MKLGSGRKFHVYLRMVVPEDEKVDSVFPGESFGKFIQRLFFSPEDIFAAARQPVVPRPSLAYPESDPRVKKAEKKLKHAVVEYAPEQTVSERHRTESVAMPQTETLSGNLDYCRLNKTLHSKFLKIAVSPYIVIALEKIHVYAPVHQLLDCSKNPDITFRHYITVFIPKVPYIPEKI